MKKIYSFLIILVVSFILTSCDGFGSNGIHSHQFDKKVCEEKYALTPATCLSSGQYYYSCSCGKCGENTFTVEPLGHSFTKYVYNENATKLANGTMTALCDRCGISNTIKALNTRIGESYTEDEIKNLNAEITFWHDLTWYEEKALDRLIFSFKRIYPNIKVTHLDKGGNFFLNSALLKGIRSGNLPTLALGYHDDISSYIKSNVVRNLDEYIYNPTFGLSANQINDYVQSSYAKCKNFDLNGTLYSLPFNQSTEVLFINASWFEENGLLSKYNLGQIKTSSTGTKYFELADGAHLTWEDIEEISTFYKSTSEYQNLSAEDKKFNCALGYDSAANLFITLTKQWGGECADSNGKLVLDNPQSKAAINWYCNHYRAGDFLTASAWDEHYTTMTGGMETEVIVDVQYASEKFKMGNLKMIISLGSQCKSNEPLNNFVLGVLPYPQKEDAYGKGIAGGEYVTQENSNIILFKNRNSDEELAGWLFMKFLTSWTPKMDVKAQPTYFWSTETGNLPILTSLRNSKEYQDFLVGDSDGYRNIVAATSAVSYAQKNILYTCPSVLSSANVRDELENLVSAVLYANTPIDDAFNDAINKLKE